MQVISAIMTLVQVTLVQQMSQYLVVFVSVGASVVQILDGNTISVVIPSHMPSLHGVMSIRKEGGNIVLWINATIMLKVKRPHF